MRERSIGVIAQDVEKVFPCLVSRGSDGYMSVEYGKLAAVLPAAVKELKEENDQLRSDLEELRTRLQ